MQRYEFMITDRLDGCILPTAVLHDSPQHTTRDSAALPPAKMSVQTMSQLIDEQAEIRQVERPHSHHTT